MSRAIGRIVGKDGSTKYAIENTTRTRIVIADKRIHILGTYGDIHVARNALCSLILGSPPNKVYARLKTIAASKSSVPFPFCFSFVVRLLKVIHKE